MSTKAAAKPHAHHSGGGRNPSPLDQEGSSAEVALSDRAAFQTFNGLWKGKKEPFVRAIVIRNTNFTADGVLDLANVAELDVEAKQLATRTLRRGDIIVERSGGGPKQAVGRVCYFDAVGEHPYSFSNFTSVIRVVDQQRLLPRYVHYYLLHLYKDGYTEGLQHATTGIRNLDFSSYLEAKVPEKPIVEQQKIAAVLWKMQRAIAIQDRLIATSRDLKQSAMQRLFTHGLRDEPLKETEIGQMPESWELVTIGEIASVGSGGTPSRTTPSYWLGGTIPWVKTGEVDYCVIHDTEEKITTSGLQHSAAKVYPKGTLLMAMYGQGVTRGKVAILGLDASINQACAAIQPRDDGTDSTFVYYVLTHNYERLRGLAHGGQQQNLNADLIRGFSFGLPKDISEQRDIASALATIDNKVVHHQKKRAALNDLFQTTLHQLMTAQIRVAELDIDTSEIADDVPDIRNIVGRSNKDQFAGAGKMIDSASTGQHD